MVIERSAVADCNAVSVTLTVILDVPAAVGVPLITPLLGFIDKPAGREPPDKVQVKVVPIDVSVESAAEYGDWTSPVDSDVVLIKGATSSVNAFTA